MSRRKLRGTLIALEGIDGSGKSTAAKTVVEVLRKIMPYREVILTKEPGGWSGGKYIRELLLDPSVQMDSVTEYLLFLADRSGHVNEVIRPALDDGSVVITERFSASSYAYQGGGLGIPSNFITDGHDLLARMRTAMITNSAIELHADLNIWFCIPPEKAWERLWNRGLGKDRIENRGVPLLHNVSQTYYDMYLHDSTWQKVDAAKTPEETAEGLWNILADHLNIREGGPLIMTWQMAKEKADVE